MIEFHSHSYTYILPFEFICQDSSETITIHSIHTTSEKTIRVRSDDAGGTFTESWDDETVPQQIHISKLPSGSLSLGPGQVAIVPVTFMPRYPELHLDGDEDDSDRPPKLASSVTARADLLQLVGEDVLVQTEQMSTKNARLLNKRNNLDAFDDFDGSAEYQVSTSVVVDTSRGVVELPITASSVKENAYGLPDSVKFLRPITSKEKKPGSLVPRLRYGANGPPKMWQESYGEVGSQNIVLIDTIHESVEVTAPSPDDNQGDQRDCFDLFLSNPLMEKELAVMEVIASKPEAVSVEFDPQKLLLTPDIRVKYTKPSQVVRDWTDDGMMHLPPDSAGNYIATVCSCPEGVDRDDEAVQYLEEMYSFMGTEQSDHNLGFVQIRTDVDTLFVSLDYIENTRPLNSTKIDPSRGSLSKRGASNSAILKADPERVKFQIIPSTNPSASAPIRLMNKSPVSIKILRATVGLEAYGEKVANLADSMGLKVDAVFKNRSDEENVSGSNNGAKALKSLVIPAASSLDDGLYLSCRVDPAFHSHEHDSFEFSGRVVIRGTVDTELRYKQWKAEMLKNPYRDSQLVLEIPFSISIFNGRVEVVIERTTHPYPQIWSAQPWDRSGRAISSLFFPTRDFQAIRQGRGNTTSPSSHTSQEIEHDLQVLSNMPIPVKLRGGVIFDDMDRSGSNLDRDSPCRRLQVSLSEAETSSRYPGFEVLGLLSLQYFFDQPGKGRDTYAGFPRSENGSFRPVTCYLSVQTTPSNFGAQRIPLVIFPALLDLLQPKHVPQALSEENDEQDPSLLLTSSAAVMGLDKVVERLNSTSGWRIFRSFLESIVDDRKAHRDDHSLLRSFLMNLCRRSHAVDNFTLRPILLKVGAVEHSDVIRSPLHFTNHHPVPITISIDIGEIEGTSISLGRDASRGRGDGNHFLDFLPESASSGRSTVNGTSKFNGHPVAGLRQFLSSNEGALKFFSNFPFRDAISICDDAVSAQPYLKALYKWHSYIEFHSDPLPHRLRPGAVSRCPGASHPASYSSQKRRKTSPGPFMVSEDGSVSRTLKVCWDINMDLGAHSDGTKIVLPPGGVARFDIRVRSPPKDLLKNDISQLLSTGLVLSTNYGEVMPILTTFEALQGQLHVSNPKSVVVEHEQHFDGEVDVKQTRVIPVPLEMHWERLRTPAKSKEVFKLIPSPSINQGKPGGTFVEPSSSDDNEVPLYLRSSFTREVRLVEVDSCNPWFRINLRNSSAELVVDPVAGIDVGEIRSSIHCDGMVQNLTESFPSFFQCALKWLSDRTTLQPQGCGVLNNFQSNRRAEDAYVEAYGGSSLRKTTMAIRKAVNILSVLFVFHGEFGVHSGANIHSMSDSKAAVYRYVKSGGKRRYGLIPTAILNILIAAWDAWRIASERGLHSISSSLRATIEYDSLPAGNEKGTVTNSLAISMQNVAVETILNPPQLYDDSVDKKISGVTEDGLPLLKFPSTPIGEVVSMYVPLKNPTSVPVRVRIATAEYQDSSKSTQEIENDDVVAKEELRKQFLMHYGYPYIQNGRNQGPPEKSAHRIWWDGHGAFFQKSSCGDLLKSHHNVTIRVGTGAHISMVNPSLHTNTAFLVGCGTRCGIRDDQKKSSESGVDVRDSAPIGGSAAVGITLVGRKRSHLSQINSMWSDEPYIPAAGFHLPGGHGPAPFAIPFSALDEVVIPPYSSSVAGPIFFRPPGRYGALGCETLVQSGSGEWGIRVAEICGSKSFDSMILLENSLTGLERVVLRGHGLLERLDFLDPPPDPGEDDFGNIELRNGHTSLLFPGSSGPFTSGETVVKEVLLHNSGDMEIFVSNLYLSSSTQRASRKDKPLTKGDHPCTFGSFRLLNCWPVSNGKQEVIDGVVIENIAAGFRLRPGESRPLFVEHIPSCSTREEFVSLHVSFDGDMKGEPRARKKGRDAQSHASLMIGYDMTMEDFATCNPASPASIGAYIVKEDVARSKSKKEAGRRTFSSRVNDSISSIKSMIWKASATLIAFLLSGCTFIGLALFSLATRSSPESADRLRSTSTTNLNKDSKERSTNGFSGNAKAAFHCLARVDPSSTELNALGREQIRQISLTRFKNRGIMAPQCFTNAGAFIRERYLRANSGAEKKEGKSRDGGVGGNDRIRTLSDALFCSFPTPTAELKNGSLPMGMGWRVAASRGIISESSSTVDTWSTLTGALSRGRIEEGSFGSSEDESVASRPDLSQQLEEKAADDDSMQARSIESATISVASSENDEPALEKEDVLSGSKGKVVSKGTLKDTLSPEEEMKDGDWIAAKREAPHKAEKLRTEQPSRQSKKKQSRPNPKQPAEPAPKAESLPKNDDTSVVKEDRPKSPQNPPQSKKKATTNNKAASKQNSKVDGEKTSSNNAKKSGEKISTKTSKQDKVTNSQKEPKQKQEKQSKSKKQSANKKKKKATENSASAASAQNARESIPEPTTNLPFIRPPPGLAPPPGFSQGFSPPLADQRSEEPRTMSLQSDPGLGPMLTAALNQDAQLSQSSTQPLSFSRPGVSSSESLYASASPPFPTAPTQESSPSISLSAIPQGGPLGEPPMAGIPSQQALDGRNEGHNEFDVMDFLDSILTDGGQSTDSLDEPAGLNLPIQSATVTANPWASEATMTTSRASAYGISFDENDNNPSTQDEISPIFGGRASPADTTTFQNVPLLTPAAILSAGYVEEDEDEAGNSFYATILSAGREDDDEEE